MRASFALIPSAALCLVALVSGCSGPPPCDAAALQGELDGASAGDVVNVRACRIEGNLVVPPGVTLRGAGDGTVIVARSGVAITLEPGTDAAPTRVESLSIESDGRVGVLGTGAGRVAATDVDVRATRGYAIGVEESAVELTRVSLDGPIDATNEASATWITVTAADTATYGIVFLGNAEATLTDVTVRGFAQYGAVVLDQDSDGVPTAGVPLTWTRGAIMETLGIGLYVSGGTSTLEQLEIGNTYRGLRGAPSYAAIFTNAAMVTTRGLHVHDNADYGVLHEGGAVVHEEPVVEGNRTAGLLAGDAGPIVMSGAALLMRNNGVANIFLLRCHDVQISDGEVSGAVAEDTLLTPSGGTPIELGDGIHLINTRTNVRLSDLFLHGNARIAVLVDLGPTPAASGITFDNVRVGADGVGLGLIGGMLDDETSPTSLVPVPPDGVWDVGATRESAALVNDASWTMALEVAGIVSPSMLPRPNDAVGIVSPSM